MLRHYRINPDTRETKQTDRQLQCYFLTVCVQQVVPAIPASQSVGFTNRMSSRQNSLLFAGAGPAARVKLAMVVHTVCIGGASGSWSAGRGKKDSLL